MILESIILENFGTYAGRQEANLKPDPEKPIILFGGMNGGGKTTLLDAIQLAFYGPTARLSNRGKLKYKEYLKESIHRGADPGEGASITLRYRRIHQGEAKTYELQRYWREGVKGIEETLRVFTDGQPDNTLTEHWEEHIEAYLPNGIAHLFFFDGEQIKDLAEGGHAAEILGTAVHSLLGLDLVDRLETDLKVFERRKRAEGLDPQALAKLKQAEIEFKHLDQEYGKLAIEEGQMTNEAGRLAKELHLQEDIFRAEGGELYLRRKELDAELNRLKASKASGEAKLRELVAGPLPLLMVQDLLHKVEQQARHETEIKRARLLQDSLASRDQELLTALQLAPIEEAPLQQIQRFLEQDRRNRIGLAEEPLVLDAEDELGLSIQQLLTETLPAADGERQRLTAGLDKLNEEIARFEAEMIRIPTEERIQHIQQSLDAARTQHSAKQAELAALAVRKEALRKQRSAAQARLDKSGDMELEARFAEDDRQRMLKHSQKVRETLATFRARVVRRHTARMQVLMLESFRQLLRKTELVSELKIDPDSFEPTLTGTDGKPLSFDRLSAGEGQLLATAMLWGLARASGRPVPTVIDTPLGRLDSSHRRHLIERYFPHASHQVLLLSTDEEIVGNYFKSLEPFITRTYLLAHDEAKGKTQIEEGYFNTDETTNRDHKNQQTRPGSITQAA